MNILLLDFTDKKKVFFKKILCDTSFKDSKIFESSSKSNFISSDIWPSVELLVWNGKPSTTDELKTFDSIKTQVPIVCITRDRLNFTEIDNDFIDSSHYLPESEITSFVLQIYIESLIEKKYIRNKLSENELLHKELEQKDSKIKDLLENSSLGIYEIDPNGNFILANKYFLDLLGLKDQSDLNEFNAFETGISTNGRRQKLKQLLIENDRINNFEDEWLRADKTKIYVKENLWAKKENDGKIKYYRGVVEEITQRKLVEQELVKSKKEAEKSDRLKSEFLTQISHEIRTPVNTLLSFGTLIEDELTDTISEDLSDCFGHMNKAGKRIIRTIDLLVKMSELHTDNYEPEFRENNLFDLIDKLINNYKPSADEKDIELHFVKAVDSANMVFDYFTVFDVFSNIIDNAIKYTNDGSVKIYIKKTLLNKISVTVIDTGIGISEKYIRNIFQPFSQETTGYTRKFDGNGLGLALVKEYCELNNSELFVSSEKNSGSNFTVIFN